MIKIAVVILYKCPWVVNFLLNQLIHVILSKKRMVLLYNHTFWNTIYQYSSEYVYIPLARHNELLVQLPYFLVIREIEPKPQFADIVSVHSA